MKKTIGENIKELREKSHFTQADLTKITGISERYISAIERGKRTPGKKLLDKLCDAFGVDEMTIRYGERTEEKPPKDELRRLADAEFDKVVAMLETGDEKLDFFSSYLSFLASEQKKRRRPGP